VARLGILTIFAWLLLVPTAWADEFDGGAGVIDDVDDQVITNAGFLIIGGLPLLILILSLIQWRLDKRKDERKQAAKRRESAPEWRGGW
jgi:hypothetical protein